jgi:aspartokinase
VSKELTHKFHIKGSNLKKSKELKRKEQYRVENSKRFAAVEILGDDMNNNKSWGSIRISTFQSMEVEVTMN